MDCFYAVAAEMDSHWACMEEPLLLWCVCTLLCTLLQTIVVIVFGVPHHSYPNQRLTLFLCESIHLYLELSAFVCPGMFVRTPNEPAARRPTTSNMAQFGAPFSRATCEPHLGSAASHGLRIVEQLITLMFSAKNAQAEKVFTVLFSQTRRRLISTSACSKTAVL